MLWAGCFELGKEYQGTLKHEARALLSTGVCVAVFPENASDLSKAKAV